MNVYDFDGTIYGGDSSVDFYFLCLRRRPRIAFYVFRQASGILRRVFKRIGTAQMKEESFPLLEELVAPEAFAALF